MTNSSKLLSERRSLLSKFLEEHCLYKVLLLVCSFHFTLMTYQNLTKYSIRLRSVELEVLMESAEQAIGNFHLLSTNIMDFKQSLRGKSIGTFGLLHGMLSSILKLIDAFDQIVDPDTNLREAEEYPRCNASKLPRANSNVNDVAPISKSIRDEIERFYEKVNRKLLAKRRGSHADSEQFELLMNGELEEIVSEKRPLFRRLFSILNLWTSHEMTLKRLGTEFQLHLNLTLNPHDCKKRSMIVCDYSQTDVQTTIHSIAYCMTLAFSTRRVLKLTRHWPWRSCTQDIGVNEKLVVQLETSRNLHSDISVFHKHAVVVVNTSKSRLPEFSKTLSQILENRIMEQVRLYHQKPEAWVIGQIVSYIISPIINKDRLSREEKRLDFHRPIVGVYVGHSEATAQNLGLSKYIEGVEKFYQDAQHRHLPVSLRRVLLVAQSSKVYREANAYTKRFTVIRRKDTNGHESTSLTDAYNMLLLARCSYLVCDMTWPPCRMTYELMQTMHGDASNRVHIVRGQWRF
ncbi:alpha-(1,6)-fucosyltransferase-like [Biomphalaria glabrata]|uniref:Alpha-(1,6)-fucosyltransferase-like n=1 Tax=Biomphalaria glabrata TaxID=6526 RepID=A0A9U8E9L5_BIOGL|nr:alpha-(1,6)-fucosyltransferase-like [Biomphalaria glabrata]